MATEPKRSADVHDDVALKDTVLTPADMQIVFDGGMAQAIYLTTSGKSKLQAAGLQQFDKLKLRVEVVAGELRGTVAVPK